MRRIDSDTSAKADASCTERSHPLGKVRERLRSVLFFYGRDLADALLF